MTIPYLLKFFFVFMAILVIIFVVTLLTPKMASVIDRIIAKIKNKPERVDDNIYKVRSIYDAQPEETYKHTDSADSENSNQ